MAFKMKGFSQHAGVSPAKSHKPGHKDQQGPIPEKNPKLRKSEMEGTWVYPGKGTKDKFVKSERIADLEDRAEFARSDAEETKGKKKKAHKQTAKDWEREANIIRDRKSKKKVDPDAPGTPGKPGYEPPVRRSDFDEGSKQQKMFDRNRAKSKARKKKSPMKQTTPDEKALQKKIAKEYKLPVSKKSSMPKNFNTKGSSGAGEKILTKQEKAAKYKGNFDKFQSQKQKGKEFVKKLGKVAKKAGKFVGGKTLGVAGMMMATSSKADQPKSAKKSEGEQIRGLLTKHKLKGGRK